MIDGANAEVKGIARYIPTTLSKAILLLLPGAAWFSFAAIRGHPSWFGIETWTPLEQTLTALVVSFSIFIALIVLLVLDMAIAVNHSKHRRIVHYSNEHPNMSLRFLWANTNVYQWTGLGLLCVCCFLLLGNFSAPFNFFIKKE